METTETTKAPEDESRIIAQLTVTMDAKRRVRLDLTGEPTWDIVTALGLLEHARRQLDRLYVRVYAAQQDQETTAAVRKLKGRKR